MNCKKHFPQKRNQAARFACFSLSLSLLLSSSACSLGNSHPHSHSASAPTQEDAIETSSTPEELIRRYEEQQGLGIPRGARALLDSTSSLPEPEANTSASAGASKLELPAAHPLGHKRALHPLKENLTAELLPLKDPNASTASARKTSTPSAASTKSSPSKAQKSKSNLAAQRSEERIAAALAEQSEVPSEKNSEEESSSFGLSGLASALREKASALLGSDSPEPSEEVKTAQLDSKEQNPKEDEIQKKASTEASSEQDSALKTSNSKEAEIDAIAEQLAEEAKEKQESVELLNVDEKVAQVSPDSKATEPNTAENIEELVAGEQELAEEELGEQELARARLGDTASLTEDSTSLFWEFVVLAFLVTLFFVALWLRLEREYNE